MVDHITDTKFVTVNIIIHADGKILNIVAPKEVEVNTPFDITYDVVNNGATEMLYGQAKIDDVVVDGTRWDEIVNGGATRASTAHFAGITANKDIYLETGYTTA